MVTLVEVAWLCADKYSMRSVADLATSLGVELQVIREIKSKYAAESRKRKRDKTGVVYVAHTDWMPLVKIGRWAGTADGLLSRYTTCYGPDCVVETWETADPAATEGAVHAFLNAHRHGGELFLRECLDDARWFLGCHTGASCVTLGH